MLQRAMKAKTDCWGAEGGRKRGHSIMLGQGRPLKFEERKEDNHVNSERRDPDRGTRSDC